MSQKLIMYNGRQMGKNYLFHEWFKLMIPTLKKGYKLGIPIESGIGVFEFKGINKYPEAKIKFYSEAQNDPR